MQRKLKILSKNIIKTIKKIIINNDFLYLNFKHDLIKKIYELLSVLNKINNILNKSNNNIDELIIKLNMYFNLTFLEIKPINTSEYNELKNIYDNFIKFFMDNFSINFDNYKKYSNFKNRSVNSYKIFPLNNIPSFYFEETSSCVTNSNTNITNQILNKIAKNFKGMPQNFSNKNKLSASIFVTLFINFILWFFAYVGIFSFLIYFYINHSNIKWYNNNEYDVYFGFSIAWIILAFAYMLFITYKLFYKNFMHNKFIYGANFYLKKPIGGYGLYQIWTSSLLVFMNFWMLLLNVGMYATISQFIVDLSNDNTLNYLWIILLVFIVINVSLFILNILISCIYKLTYPKINIKKIIEKYNAYYIEILKEGN